MRGAWAGKAAGVPGLGFPLYFILENNGVVTLEDQASTCEVGGVSRVGTPGVCSEEPQSPQAVSG